MIIKCNCEYQIEWLEANKSNLVTMYTIVFVIHVLCILKPIDIGRIPCPHYL